MKAAIQYTLVKYGEFSIVALLTLYFTHTASEAILAQSSYTFLMISYGVYFALGVHNGVVRNASIEENQSVRERLLFLEIIFSGFVAFCLVVASQLIGNWWLSIGLLIASANHFKTACQTVYRIRGSDRKLNYLNGVWPVLFGISFYVLYFLFSVKIEAAFFSSWLISIYVVSIPFFITETWWQLNEIGFSSAVYTIRKEFLEVISASKYMLVMMISTSLLLTYDRLWLNYHAEPQEIVAKFQFIDTLSNVYFLGICSIVYYFTPRMLKSYSFNGGLKVFFSHIKIAIVSLFSTYILFNVAGHAYLYLTGRLNYDYSVILLLMVLSKSIVILLGVVGNYLLAVKHEKLLAIIYIITVALLAFLVNFLFAALDFVYLPAASALMALFSIISLFVLLRRGVV